MKRCYDPSQSFWGPRMENELQYYSRRAAEELLAAARAEKPEAQQRHRALAERYAIIVQRQENAARASNETGIKPSS